MTVRLPRKLPKRPKRDNRVRCPGHLAFIRLHMCVVPGCNDTIIEAAHVRSSRDGGIAMKPGDQFAVSLCHWHHEQQHVMGEPQFQRFFQVDLLGLAQEFARRSPALARYRAKQKKKAAK